MPDVAEKRVIIYKNKKMKNTRSMDNKAWRELFALIVNKEPIGNVDVAVSDLNTSFIVGLVPFTPSNNVAAWLEKVLRSEPFPKELLAFALQNLFQNESVVSKVVLASILRIDTRTLTAKDYHYLTGAGIDTASNHRMLASLLLLYKASQECDWKDIPQESYRFLYFSSWRAVQRMMFSAYEEEFKEGMRIVQETVKKSRIMNKF